MKFLGVDLSSSPKRPSTYALLSEHLDLLVLDSFREDHELPDLLERHDSPLTAIDAPLTLPLGTDCLEEECPCTPVLNQKGRLAELQLSKMRIGCFFTSKRSIIKKLIYRAVRQHENLRNKGHQVIEVYPYATKVMLFGDGIPAKNSRKGLDFIKARVCELIPDALPHIGNLNHQKCDALIAAYTALLNYRNETDRLGNEQEGYIIVPKLAYRNGHGTSLTTTSTLQKA